MNKQQLAAKIWESANRMRSKIEANEYKDYILGFIFYKYLSDKEERWLIANEYTAEDIKDYVNEEDTETLENVQQSLGLHTKTCFRHGFPWGPILALTTCGLPCPHLRD